MWKRSFHAKSSLKHWQLKMWKRRFRARCPSKTESSRCENEAFVRRPSKTESWRCENKAFMRGIPQKLKAEDVKTKLSCAASLKNWKLKIWKRSYRVGRPSKTESWRCENKAFMRGIPQKLKAEDPQKLKVQDVKMRLSCGTSLKNWKLKMWKQRHPSKTEIWRYENEAIVWDVPQKLKVEDVKTKLSCAASLKNWKLKIWKRSYRVGRPSKTES